MNQEAEQIRAAVRGLRRPSANTRYPRDLRRRVTEYVRRRRGEGASWDGVAAEVGISVYTLRDWLERMRNAECGVRNDEGRPPETRNPKLETRDLGPSPAALLPVRVKAEEAVAVEAGRLELTTPQGYRLSGLTAAQALELLRRLS